MAIASSVGAQVPEYFPLKPGARKHFQATVNQNTSVGGQSAMSNTAYFRNTEEVIGIDLEKSWLRIGDIGREPRIKLWNKLAKQISEKLQVKQGK